MFFIPNQVEKKSIFLDGVFVRNLDLNVDDRGCLFELTRIDWESVLIALKVKDNNAHHLDLTQLIQQVYIVQNHNEAIRAYHKHEKLVDLFCITNGYAKFVLIDDRPKSPTFNKHQVIDVCGRKPQLIGVPVGVFHGWKGSKDCTLVSVANKLYKGWGRVEELDEERIAWDIISKDIWNTQYK